MYERDRTLGSLLATMERAAEMALRTDSSFFEALHALKWQIESDAHVQTVVGALADQGFAVSHSFLPNIRVKVKDQKTASSPAFSAGSAAPETDDVASTLTQQLKYAAYEVISSSVHRQRLEQIINEAVFTSGTFRSLASQLETAGYELVICLDFSNYPQLREKIQRTRSLESTDSQLTPGDREFLKAMRIRPDAISG